MGPSGVPGRFILSWGNGDMEVDGSIVELERVDCASSGGVW